MVPEAKFKKISQSIFQQSGFFDQVEVLLGTSDQTTIRFAQNHIYQPLTVTSAWLKIRFIKDKRILVLNLGSFSSKQIKKTITTAKRLIAFQEKDKNFVSLPKSKTIKVSPEKAFNLKASKIKEERLVKLAWQAIELTQKKRLIASGKLEKTVSQLAIGNSLGTWQYQPSCLLSFSTVIQDGHGNASGYGQSLGQNIKDLNIKKTTLEAIKTTLNSKRAQKIDPGEYEVILMPGAFQEILPFFSWLGPNARIYHEEVSFLKGQIGKKIFSPKLTITDQPLNPLAPSYFDYEGYPKTKLTLVKQGVPTHLVYDSYYSHKYKQKNTGHGLPAPNTEGPVPLHLIIKTGNSSLEKMIASTKKGLLINRLWYIRVVHYKNLVLTGMTRDGTFLIENGKIKHAIQNLRFTDSIPRIFKHITEVEDKAYWQDAMGGIAKIPALKISKFKFTS